MTATPLGNCAAPATLTASRPRDLSMTAISVVSWSTPRGLSLSAAALSSSRVTRVVHLPWAAAMLLTLRSRMNWLLASRDGLPYIYATYTPPPSNPHNTRLISPSSRPPIAIPRPE